MLPYALEVYDTEGIQYQPSCRNLRFAKTLYGGEDLWMTFVLDRSGSIDYPDVGYGHDVILRKGLKPIFVGEMRQIDADLETITVKALGNWVYLDDYGYGGGGKLWCESRYERWRVITDAMAATERPEKYVHDNINRIFMAPKYNETFTPNQDRCGYYYYSPYDKVVRVSLDYTAHNITTFDWQVHLYSNTGTPDSWGVETSEWLCADWSTMGVKDITLSNPRNFIHFSLFWGFAGPPVTYLGETGVNVFVEITNIRLWGENGPLSRGIENPSVIHMAEDMIGQIEATTPISAEEDKVQESLYVRDTFTDANGTPIGNHVPDIDKEGGGWQAIGGTMDIQGNELRSTAVLAEYVVDAGVSDGIVSLDAGSQNQYFGLAFRVDADNDQWLWIIDCRVSPGMLTLYRRDPGWTIIWQSAVGMEPGYWYNLMVKLRGDRIDCYCGGVWRCGTNDSFNQNSTRHGVRAGASGLLFDNFEVYQALPFWPLFYERGESCHKALEDGASFGDWDFKALGWGVEAGGDKVFLRRANRSKIRYVIPPQYATRLSAKGQTDKDFVTEAWGQYIDEDGQMQYTDKYYAHVTPTGIVANTTATGDDRASVVYGVMRDRAIPFGRVDAGLAVEYLKRYLVEHAYPQVRSAFEVYGPVQDWDRGGIWIDPCEMEMGYMVQIPYFRAVEAEGANADLRDWDTTFLLVAMQVDTESGKVRLVPEGASEDLERIMEAARRYERGEIKAILEKRV